ncbi:antibiotic biosynthesis monooxygenase family protein [Actinomadura formosensis]|uniref:antibiotic biosynthesis monooxygenase family protein n=1 Tax=Actinomadura formosensis TaxID=60706 RepID=UPI000834E208|nr:antibiotic biosynthesis monooxygenase family protein [Actinomadura formosensis]
MITLINKVTVVGDRDAFERAQKEIEEFMHAQPGARRFQLLQSPDRPDEFVEVAEWESRELHLKAVRNPEFLERAKALRAHAEFEREAYTVLRVAENG